MNKIILMLISGFQILGTFIVMFCIYMVFAFFDNDFGLDGLFGLVVFQPILAFIITVLTIFVCLLIGLPIRLNYRINYWCTSHYYISLIGIVVGLVLLLLAALPNFREAVFAEIDGEVISKQIPNMRLVGIGWFTTAFFVLHTFPSRRWIEKVEEVRRRVSS